jgi:hypothetical protein
MRKTNTVEPDQRKPGFYLTLKATTPPNQIAALPAVDQANLAHKAFGALADKLTECGIAPDLVATAALDLGYELAKLDGSPPRVVRIDPRKESLR